jgi:hypothetical protein
MMAVEALNPFNTERWFYDYSVYGDQHSLMMRVDSPRSATEAAEQIDAFLSAIAGNLVEITTVGLRVALAGSNITNAQGTAGLAATYGSGAGSDINAPLQVTFTGRSSDGHKSRVGIFGWLSQTDSSWRITVAEDADVASGVSILQGLSPSGFFVSISGAAAEWHGYANIGYNDHWIKERRG